MKLSIITVCYNEAARIRETLLSVYGQTYPHIEHVIVDGASTDGSVGIIQEFAEHYASFVSEPDRGIYHAMNKGILRATGDYLLFLNAGDRLHAPDVIETLLAGASGDLDVIHGKCHILSESGLFEKVYGADFSLPERLELGSIPHPATLYKASLFQQFGPYDETYKVAADYAFNAKALYRPAVKSRYVDLVVSDFFRGGVSSGSHNIRLLKEKRHIQQRYIYNGRLSYYKNKWGLLWRSRLTYLKRHPFFFLSEQKRQYFLYFE